VTDQELALYQGEKVVVLERGHAGSAVTGTRVAIAKIRSRRVGDRVVFAHELGPASLEGATIQPVGARRDLR
jgi:hypothetical protein